MKPNYTVNQLAKLAGISVRALHVYDRIGLLKPAGRTFAGYRQYGETELLRLQQILFYKELDVPLKTIIPILDNPDFDLVKALEGHKAALISKRDNISTLLGTIDHTITQLKNKSMKNYEELYEGMPGKQAAALRNEAIEKWGEEAVSRSEKALLEMHKMDMEQLKAEQKAIARQLRDGFIASLDTEGEVIQELIARHYANIRSFWGVSNPTDLKRETYKGLAELYVTDGRYTAADGQPDPGFARFMRHAMIYFADTQLI